MNRRALDAIDAGDPLKRLRVQEIALRLVDDAWEDIELLKGDAGTVKVAGQLYEAIGSIAANIAEGYSKSSGRDRARIFEIALGSSREAMVWYKASVPVLGYERVIPKYSVLEEIRRMLLAIIPRERDRVIRPRKPQP